MKKILLPGTDINISRLSFGTASIHHVFGEKNRHRLINTALEYGFTHFDTSPLYGYGIAEQTLGSSIPFPNSDITIASKFGLYPPGGLVSNHISLYIRKGIRKIIGDVSKPLVDWTIKKAEASLINTLNSLRRDYLDILFLHEPHPSLIDTDEVLQWLVTKKDQGKIREWGLAGPINLYHDLIIKKYELASVLQVRDNLHNKEADVVLASGRPLQFTYGYLSPPQSISSDSTVVEVIGKALTRNNTGSIIVTSRKKKRLITLAKAHNL